MFCGEFDFDLATAVTRSYTFDQCPDFIVDFEAKKNGSTNQYFKIWKKTKSEITVSGLVPQKFSEDFNLIYTHPLTNRKSSLNEEVSLVCRK